MRYLSAPARQLLNVITRQLIPWASSGSGFVSLDAPPEAIGANNIIEQPGKALPLKTDRYGGTIGRRSWEEENLNSMAIPYLGCVVEGEADIVVGTTTAMCRKMKIPGKRWIIQMPKGNFFLLPPGVPISQGLAPHWKRPHPEKAYSHIFWMQIHDAGGSCHFSTTQNGKLLPHPHTFVYSKHLLPLAQTILDEMSAKSPHYISMIYLHLAILFNHMARSLENESKHADQEKSTFHRFAVAPIHSDLQVQRAVDYIDENMNNTALSAEKIALHVRLSVAHLNRLFHRQLDMPVMRFVWQRRLELGRQLLLNSSYNVMQIGFRCGYAHTSSFVEAFIRNYGVSPVRFRDSHFSDDQTE